MGEGWPHGGQFSANVQADARIALGAMPVAPVAVELTECERNRVRRDLDFLQADDIRALALDPLVDLRFPRPNAVDVPGGDLNGWGVPPRAPRLEWPSVPGARRRAPERSLLPA